MVDLLLRGKFMNNFRIYLEVFDRLNELYFSNKEKYDDFGILLG